MSDESRLEPENDGSNDDHCAVVDGAFLVAGRQPPPLFEPVDAALDHIPPRVNCLIEDQGATRSRRATRALIAALRDGVRDLPPLEQPAAARITVAFVGDDAIWSSTGTSASAWSWDTNTVQYRRQLGTVMPLSWGNDDRKRSPFAITGQVKLGRQPSATVSEPLVTWVAYALFFLPNFRPK